MKKAILIVSFGTTDPAVINKCILPLEQAAAAAFPSWHIFRCFTSGMVIHRLSQSGICVDSLKDILARLVREEYRQVVILPTLLTDGGEYRKILDICASFRSCFDALDIGKPLLSDPEDFSAVADFLQTAFPLDAGEALLLMGHGTKASDNPGLQALGNTLMRRNRRIFLAALAGDPPFAEILPQIRAAGCSKVLLVPLMLTAGTHVLHQLSGPEETSWLSRCRAAGLESRCRLTGLGEFPGIRALYLRHLSDCFTEK